MSISLVFLNKYLLSSKDLQVFNYPNIVGIISLPFGYFLSSFLNVMPIFIILFSDSLLHMHVTVPEKILIMSEILNFYNHAWKDLGLK